MTFRSDRCIHFKIESVDFLQRCVLARFVPYWTMVHSYTDYDVLARFNGCVRIQYPDEPLYSLQ
jgi:hypothetical protein